MSDIRIVYSEFDLAAVGDEWEALVSAGQQIAEAHDRNRWTLGDLGGKVLRRYGEDSIGSYAAAINVRPSTMYDYAACAAYYSVEDRAAFPPLSWSHFRAAMKASTKAIALEWLGQAADMGWSVDTLAEHMRVAVGQAPKPAKLGELGAEYLGYSALRPGSDFGGASDEDAEDVPPIALVVSFRVTPDAAGLLDGLGSVAGVVTLKIFGVPQAQDSDMAEETL